MLRRKKFIIAGLIVLLAVGFLVYWGLGNSLAYYSTVGELMAKGDSVYGTDVRVNGEVAPGSIARDTKNLMLRFTLAGEVESLPVVYQGAQIPDAFTDGADVVVEGKLDSDGTFHADIILAKCPSKYEPEE
jgi:cytochrome c-type biogenesis protein CcmE